MNGLGYEDGNDAFTDGRDLPWLQETADEAAWSLWGVEYRDVVILDADGAYSAAFNLSEYDLEDPSNQQVLLDLIDDAG